MRDKIHDPRTKFVVAKWSSGLILSEWLEIESARVHRDAVCSSYQGVMGAKCPYAIYTRAEWESGFQSAPISIDTSFMLLCAEGAAD